MIFKLVILCALVASPALGSAIKGYREEPATKGGARSTFLAPVEQQRLVAAEQHQQVKTTKLEHVAEQQPLVQQKEEQQPLVAEQKLEELSQQKEEVVVQQRHEEAASPAKGQRYEAKPQVSHEELAKGQQQVLKYEQRVEQAEQQPLKTTATRYEQREEKSATRYEQREEKPATRYEQREEKPATRYEQREEKPATRYEQREEKPATRYEQREEKPATRYEQREEKPATRYEQREEKPATRYEQRQEQELSKTRYEQKQLEERFEQQQRPEYDTQQIELKEEQRKYDEQAPAIVEEIQQQQVQYNPPAKGYGAGASQVPLAEAEPYAFSYQVDGSSRSESGDTKGAVRGQYTLQGADGSQRVVDYVADHNGFRASVNTNELGTEAKSPANIALRTSQPLAEEITLKLEGKTKEDFASPSAAPVASGVKGVPALVAAPAPVLAKPENWSVKGGSLPLPQALAVPQAPIAALEETKSTKSVVEEAARATLAKGQRLVQQEEPLQQQQELLAQVPVVAHEQVKSAELRAPKSLGENKSAAQQQIVQTRSSFESATAHRVYRPVTPVQPPVRHAPAIPVRAQPPPVISRGPVPAVSRAYLQRERYPPSPVQGYRRGNYAAAAEQPLAPGNPRVSFYAPSSSANFDDEPGTFEQPDS